MAQLEGGAPLAQWLVNRLISVSGGLVDMRTTGFDWN